MIAIHTFTPAGSERTNQCIYSASQWHEISLIITSFMLNNTQIHQSLPKCCSMTVLSVKGIFLLSTFPWPLFKMSSRTDFRLGNLAKIYRRDSHHIIKHIYLRCNILCWVVFSASPPGNIGLDDSQHVHGDLADFNKGSTEDFTKPQHLYCSPHSGTDAFNPVNTSADETQDLGA